MNPGDAARWRRIDAILDELLVLEPQERAGRLAELAGDDRALRDEVEGLLHCDETDDGLLDHPASDHFGELLGSGATTESEDRDLAGREVGPFRILGRLGEGGMGVVFEARQSHPPRTVALKVLRAGVFAGTQQLRMFRREAESLGRLNHPGIAAIHDAGRTDDGLHWFAMERVHGEPLDTWRHVAGAGAALEAQPPARVVQQDLAHGGRGNRKEMLPVLPSHLAVTRQLEVRLVDDRRGVERRAAAPVGDPPVGDLAHVGIDQLKRLVQGVGVPTTGGMQRQRDVVGPCGFVLECPIFNHDNMVSIESRSATNLVLNYL